MTDAEFQRLADIKFNDIEQAVESAQEAMDWALDWEHQSGVLTLIIESNKSQVILSRQAAIAELWVAAKSGGYHFTYDNTAGDNGQWVDKTGQTLEQCIETAILDQGGLTLSLPL